MKPTSKFAWNFIIVAVFLGSLCLADRPYKPILPKELAGVYTGFSEGNRFCRLDLRSDFTGYLAFVSMPDDVRHEDGATAYRITRWSLERSNLSFTLAPSKPKLDDINLKGFAGAFCLLLEMSQGTNQWQAKACLYREEQTQITSRETREAIERMERN